MRKATAGILAIALAVGVLFAANTLFGPKKPAATDEIAVPSVDGALPRTFVSNRDAPRSRWRNLLVSYVVDAGYTEPDSERLVGTALEGLADCQVRSLEAGDPNHGGWDSCEREVMRETGTEAAFSRLFNEYIMVVGVRGRQTTIN